MNSKSITPKLSNQRNSSYRINQPLPIPPTALTTFLIKQRTNFHLIKHRTNKVQSKNAIYVKLKTPVQKSICNALASQIRFSIVRSLFATIGIVSLFSGLQGFQCVKRLSARLFSLSACLAGDGKKV